MQKEPPGNKITEFLKNNEKKVLIEFLVLGSWEFFNSKYSH